MPSTNELIKKEDTSVKVDSYLIDFFDMVPNTIKGKNNKLIDMLLNTNINPKDYPNNKILLHIYAPVDTKDKLKIKQKELGFPNFSHFVNANLRKFYDDRHKYEHKTIKKTRVLKPKINFAKFKRLVRKCKKKLIEGEYTSYDKNIKRCTLSVQQLRQKDLDWKESDANAYTRTNCYSELEQSVGWNINSDCLESFMLSYIRHYEYNLTTAYGIYIKNYDELIGLNVNNIIEYEAKLIEKYDIPKETYWNSDNTKQYEAKAEPLVRFNKTISNKYDVSVPNINTYFYLWIYYIYHENKIYSNVNFAFNTDDAYAEKLLEKYTVENIFDYYLKLDNKISIENIFDNETIEYLNSNELVNLSILISGK